MTLSTASDGLVPVPSQGSYLVARFDPSTDPRVAAKAKAEAGVEGWLLAETPPRATAPGFVLGTAGHPLPQLDLVGRVDWQSHRWPHCGQAASQTRGNWKVKRLKAAT